MTEFAYNTKMLLAMTREGIPMSRKIITLLILSLLLTGLVRAQD